jgi:hypothetical protein
MVLVAKHSSWSRSRSHQPTNLIQVRSRQTRGNVKMIVCHARTRCHVPRNSRRTLKLEPLAKPPANKSDPSAKPPNKRKRQDDCVPCTDKMPRPTKQPGQQPIVSPTPKENSVLPTDFQDWVNLLHQDFKRSHLGWEFPFNIVSFVPTAKALLPNKLLARFEDEPVSKKHEDEPPSKKKQDVRDIVVNGRTTKDVPVLFGVCSHSLVVKLSRSHLQMRAVKRVLCRLRCMPAAHMRGVFGSHAASHPQAVPANVELVSVIAWHTLFSQWNQMIQTLTNKLTPQKPAFTGAAPTILVSPD